MKKYLSSLFLSSCALLISAPALAQGTYQLKNAGFEEWEDVSYNKKAGKEPKYWNSFLTGTGNLKSKAVSVSQCDMSTDVRSGSASTYSAKIIDYDVKLGKIHLAYANGNLTTGRINMGSMKASDSSGNYNFTDTSNDDFNQKFTGLPDAMNVWVKYHSTNSSYRAKATTILHVAGYYQDPSSDENKMVSAVATATDTTIQSNDTWTELTIPFTYSLTDGTRPAYALVSFSTNATPGTGSDYLLIDDLSYVYYHTLSALSYDGKSILEDGKTAYDLSTEAYDAEEFKHHRHGGRRRHTERVENVEQYDVCDHHSHIDVHHILEAEILRSENAMARNVHHAVAEHASAEHADACNDDKRTKLRRTRTDGRIEEVYRVVADTYP